MKIVHIVMSESFAGIEQHVNELLANNLTSNPILICNESIAKFYSSKINIFEIKNYSRRSWFGKYKLMKILKQINPDIVHTHGSKTTSLVASVNKNKFKHIATVHGIKKNKSIYEKADFVIGVSSPVLEGIKVPSNVITNWWNPSLNPISKNNDKKYALSIGRLEKVKGFDLLIKSWINIKSKLIIIGSGKEKNNLIKLINDLNLKNKIKIIDQVDPIKLLDFYNEASMVIISSINEGGPRVALEALHLKIPVLSTNVGHMDQIFSEDLLAKRNNLESLKNLFESYVDNIDLLNQEAIYEYVTDEFSLDKKIKQIQETYKSLLSN